MKKGENLIGQLSSEDVQELKRKHPEGIVGIKTVTGKIAYFRKPTWEDLNIAASQSSPDMPLDYTKQLLIDCFIGGCEDLITVQADYQGAIQSFNKVLDGTKTELVEL